MKMYRGACTVKDWTNTTACPTRWCDKGKCPRPMIRLYPNAQLCPTIMTAADSFFPVSVWPSSSSNIWQCPPVNNGPIRWWCGDSTVTTPCQSGVNASFYNPTTASELGLPPVTFSQSVATKTVNGLVIIIFSPGLTDSKATTVPAMTYTDPSVPAQTPAHSASLPTAVGFGVGIPLGIAAIGFLGFLYWRAVGRQDKSRSRILSQENALGNGDRSASVAIDRPWPRLPDAQLPIELDDFGRRELPST